MSNILRDLEESDMKFVNQNVAEFLRDEIENFNIVKKVAYISNN